ncbi:DUF190 domain-containing protein [Streptomyces sp. cg35]|uniref:DUF190 domain-containing protein n=1 Tax=Streptomyces sp. cg35 TaxID=3421650 RepID=UPI003D17CD60
MSHTTRTARLTIHLDGATLWRHRPAYIELVQRAHQTGLAGASVFHGVAGFAFGPEVRRLRPCMLVLVDGEDRLRLFLLTAQDVLEAARAVAVLDHVQVHEGAEEAADAG